MCKRQQENFIVCAGISSHLLETGYTVANRDVPVEEKSNHLINSPKRSGFFCKP